MLACRYCDESLGWATEYCPFCGKSHPVVVMKEQMPLPALDTPTMAVTLTKGKATSPSGANDRNRVPSSEESPFTHQPQQAATLPLSCEQPLSPPGPDARSRAHLWVGGLGLAGVLFCVGAGWHYLHRSDQDSRGRSPSNTGVRFIAAPAQPHLPARAVSPPTEPARVIAPTVSPPVTVPDPANTSVAPGSPGGIWAPQSSDPDDDKWRQVVRSGSCDAYHEYDRSFVDGRHAAEAREHLLKCVEQERRQRGLGFVESYYGSLGHANCDVLSAMWVDPPARLCDLVNNTGGFIVHDKKLVSMTNDEAVIYVDVEGRNRSEDSRPWQGCLDLAWRGNDWKLVHQHAEDSGPCAGSTAQGSTRPDAATSSPGAVIAQPTPHPLPPRVREEGGKTPESVRGTQPSMWQADWGNNIRAIARSIPCAVSDFKDQGYRYSLSVDIPESRLRTPAEAWNISAGRAQTVQGCWFIREDGLAHAKMRRKKDAKVWEDDYNFDDGSWHSR